MPCRDPHVGYAPGALVRWVNAGHRSAVYLYPRPEDDVNAFAFMYDGTATVMARVQDWVLLLVDRTGDLGWVDLPGDRKRLEVVQ